MVIGKQIISLFTREAQISTQVDQAKCFRAPTMYGSLVSSPGLPASAAYDPEDSQQCERTSTGPGQAELISPILLFSEPQAPYKQAN